ncbi:MAG: NAD-dependent epimerase/dehydratase family protein [Chloroflexi bacterium]|nr:NAD-dependent epimerase/dehydratase family protein [Chloroflexota bacterium]
MNILIIGGTGLISTPISRQLLAAGHSLTLYNRGQTESRLEGAFTHIRGDRNNLTTFEEKIAACGPFDCVIDMVCYQPEQAESTIRALAGRVGQFIFCSTVDVYTKPPSTFPVLESHPRESLSDYGREKAACEDLFMAAHHAGHFPVTILRPASTYGEGGPIIHTFGKRTSFLDRLRQGKPIIVHGDGESLWVSCYVDDVARAFVNAVGNETAFGEAYHLAGEEWQTWNQYYERLALAIGAPKPKLIHIPADILVRISPEGTMVTYLNFQYTNIFDNSAAKRDLGFEVTVDWLTGSKRTYDWLEAHQRIEDWQSFPLYDQIIDEYRQQCNKTIANISGYRHR